VAALWPTRTKLLGQYHAAIDVFERAVRRCPAELWHASVWPVLRSDPGVWPSEGNEPVPERTDESIQVFSAFWNVAAHTAFFLDFYVSGPKLEGYVPPSPFERESQGDLFAADGAVTLPDWTYTKAEILGYIAYGRDKADRVISSMTVEDQRLKISAPHPWAGISWNELLRVNLNHIKEHGGQMAAFLEGAA